jgi:hypothetical protein
MYGITTMKLPYIIVYQVKIKKYIKRVYLVEKSKLVSSMLTVVLRAGHGEAHL